MQTTSLSALGISSAVLGVFSHFTFWIHGEHDLWTAHYAAIWICGQAAAFFVLVSIFENDVLDAVTKQSVISSAYLLSLFTSIVLYRVFFHKLRHFPGPTSWSITKLAHVSKNSDGFGFKHLDELHKRYGNVVRTGPNEISIIDPMAPQAILGSTSKCIKATWYEMSRPFISLHTVRDKKTHDTRRHAWSGAFSTKSIQEYEERVNRHSDKLIARLRGLGGKKFSAPKWFHYFTFDVMSDLAYGETFHMLDKGEDHYAAKMITESLAIMNVVPAAPWIFQIFIKMPVLAAAWWDFLKWTDDQAEKRRVMDISGSDTASHLIKAPPMSKDETVNKDWYSGDLRLLIVAGSDTTANTLSYCIYELLRQPETLRKLRDEVRPFVSQGRVDHSGLSSCHFLMAIINETLRLHPANHSGLVRIAPKEGVVVNKTHIPGGSNIVIPFYSIQRSPEAFVQPDDFIPERWTSKPELIKERGAWVPWSLGSFSCIGKNFAYMEMRAVLAKFVTEFDFAFAENEDGSAIIEKSTDHFVQFLEDMWVVCSPRQA